MIVPMKTNMYIIIAISSIMFPRILCVCVYVCVNEIFGYCLYVFFLDMMVDDYNYYISLYLLEDRL